MMQTCICRHCWVQECGVSDPQSFVESLNVATAMTGAQFSLRSANQAVTDIHLSGKDSMLCARADAQNGSDTMVSTARLLCSCQASCL